MQHQHQQLFKGPKETTNCQQLLFLVQLKNKQLLPMQCKTCKPWRFSKMFRHQQ
jgi:hypothetical protein